MLQTKAFFSKNNTKKFLVHILVQALRWFSFQLFQNHHELCGAETHLSKTLQVSFESLRVQRICG